MKADVILGLQWGDEGKGKIVDLLTPKYNIVARFQGGPNAGHTIEANGMKHVLHLIPSGIFHPNIQNVIGNGVIIDPHLLMQEINGLLDKGLDPRPRLMIGRRAHLILPTHRLMDACLEQCRHGQKIGSTLKGIGPTYTDKSGRNGLRIGEIFSADFDQRYQLLKSAHLSVFELHNFNPESVTLDGMSLTEYEQRWFEALEEVRKLQIIDCEHFINQSLYKGLTVLAEGAQGALLDVDFGSYPYVTSSNTIAGGVCTGLGLAPGRIGEVFGIFKAYCTRVGNGPFPTELLDDMGEYLRQTGHEFGATTGRPRRCGWLDLPALRYSVMINGVTQLVMMKSDVLDDLREINVCTSYQTREGAIPYYPFDISPENISPIYASKPGWNTSLKNVLKEADMPEALAQYIAFIEKETQVPVRIISTGPERNQTIFKPSKA